MPRIAKKGPRPAPWSVRGVTAEARNAAIAAAHREGQTLGEWLDRAIRQRFGLPLRLSPRVQQVDLVMLATERRDVLAAALHVEWPCLRGVRPLDRPIPPMSSDRCEALFYRRFFELTVDRTVGNLGRTGTDA